MFATYLLKNLCPLHSLFQTTSAIPLSGVPGSVTVRNPFIFPQAHKAQELVETSSFCYIHAQTAIRKRIPPSFHPSKNTPHSCIALRCNWQEVSFWFSGETDKHYSQRLRMLWIYPSVNQLTPWIIFFSPFLFPEHSPVQHRKACTQCWQKQGYGPSLLQMEVPDLRFTCSAASETTLAPMSWLSYMPSFSWKAPWPEFSQDLAFTLQQVPEQKFLKQKTRRGICCFIALSFFLSSKHWGFPSPVCLYLL